MNCALERNATASSVILSGRCWQDDRSDVDSHNPLLGFLGWFHDPVGAVRMNPYFDAVRGATHAIGLRLSRGRQFNGTGEQVGIWVWIDEVIKEIERSKTGGFWEYQVPDIETVRRRISELADERIQDPPLWVHLPKKYPDIDPFNGRGHVRRQSTYIPNPKVFEEEKG